ECGPAWSGVRFAAVNGSPEVSHAVDVTGYLDRGIESLRCHELYLANLGEGAGDMGAFLRSGAESTGARLGVLHAVAFEIVNF
ncbi:MAG: PIG-L family deacetylase, partial [Ilumatobacteraceae bacterium]